MKNTVRLERPVYILSSATVAGAEESAGPLGAYFNVCGDDSDSFGCDTWEKAESEMQRKALSAALSAAGLKDNELDAMLAGDLLNQCTGSAYGLISFDAPFIGLYGACSTMAEGLLTGALLCQSAYRRCAAVASSHNASAERQFRFPLEYGAQRAPTSQWTATAAGAYILTNDIGDLKRLGSNERQIRITCALAGRVVDGGVTDQNNMGAAMAPSAADTLTRYFRESGRMPEDCDLILTGDLGREGSGILTELMSGEGYDIRSNYNDCGLLLYDGDTQDKHAGASGCGCSAAVLAAYALRSINEGKYKSVLFVGTGALMSPMSVQQGATIPGIAHLVHISAGGDER